MSKVQGHREATEERAPAGAAPQPPFATFEQAVAHLYARTDLERLRPSPAVRDAYKLDRMHALCRALGSPQESFRSVHVAGTKGKGSTCEMCAAMLEGGGYTVGIYTSPHLTDVRERIRIGRRPVSEALFTQLTTRVCQAAAGIVAEHGPATFFELTTAMAFCHFAEQAVDVAVIEVGLGGLLDCTNVLRPEVCAITTLGMDHMEILGPTIQDIARQKAGIFKPGVPALSVQQPSGAMEVVRAEAQRIGAPLRVVGDDLEFSFRVEYAAGSTAPQAYVQLTTAHREYDFVPVPLMGEHQALNCGLALAIVDTLASRDMPCSEEGLLAGLATVRLPGRFELVNTSPRFLLDGAHNPESMRALMKAAGQYASYDALVVVFGCAADKDIGPMLRALAGAADKVIFTSATDNKRAMDPAKLQKMYQQLDGPMSLLAPTLPQALELARRSSQLGDLICVTGSFYVVGEARRWLAERLKKK